MSDLTPSPTAFTGGNFLGGQTSHAGADTFTVASRIDGAQLSPAFAVATEEEVATAVVLAADAFPAYSAKSPAERAAFLEAIATEIEALGDALLERAHHESGLPLPRLTGERGRTCGQLRQFASVIRDGSWVDARIDHADAQRTPPKPDIRRMLVALGPVAVFGASNFPLAFSVAGGDTASALAAGCPVVFKAHPAHPGTCELVARAIVKAAESTGMPSGVFGMVHGAASVGVTLAKQPALEAIAFTGSQAAGRALFDLAAARPKPIPVYAEMGSVNPVFVLPGAIQERGDAIAKGYAESLTLGVGQFCTNPGVLVGVASDEFDRFLTHIGEHLANVAPGTMLTEGICDRFAEGRKQWETNALLTPVFEGGDVPGKATPALFSTTGRNLLDHPHLAEENFGPGALAVRCESIDELMAVAETMEGQLTATLQVADGDRPETAKLLPMLARFAGRVLVNGFPTGVEVSPSMQHGGPYPATTDSRSTSVGTAAILRFARPVAYQGVPDDLLPEELREANPRGIRRTVDGVWS